MTNLNGRASRAFLPQGFTLVEVLMVITIVSLLISLLIPSVSQARLSAQYTICSSQLRQQGIGMCGYASDNHNYFPVLGGPIAWDPYNRYCNNWDAISFNAGAYNDFGSYIGLYVSGTSTPQTSTAKIKYCPTVNWFIYPAIISQNIASLRYANGVPGYAYYCGRKMYNSTNHNFDTVKRRDDPKEILMTDQLSLSSETAGGQAHWTSTNPVTMTSNINNFFNPHADRSCTLLRQGSANHLTADGHVANLDITQGRSPLVGGTGPINFMISYYAGYYFNGSIANIANSLDNGPYAAIP